MPMFKVGDKVIIHANERAEKDDEYKRLINGHTCIVRKVEEVRPFYPKYCQGESHVYLLDWFQADNPGRKCEIIAKWHVWIESDFIPVPVFSQTIRASQGLPDI